MAPAIEFMQNSNNIKADLRNWVPIRLSDNLDNLLCRWLYTGSITYTDPFFNDTITKCLSLSENSKGFRVNATLEILPEWAENLDPLPPTAFIFHVSRCGSTLVSQALGMIANSIALSEVALFDEILRLPLSRHNFNEEYSNQLLSAAIKFYGNKRTGSENKLFIKTDSWHLLFYKRLRTLFPSVPFIVLYREPGGVLESNKRSKGMQGNADLVGTSVYGFETFDDDFLHPDNYMAHVLEKFYRCIIDITTNDPHTLLLNYAQGLNDMMEQIATFIGLELNTSMLALIAERSKYHAKQPEKKFVELNKSDVSHPLLDQLNRLYEHIELIRNKAW